MISVYHLITYYYQQKFCFHLLHFLLHMF